MTAYAYAIDPALDYFDDVDGPAAVRSGLRVITGGRRVQDPSRSHRRPCVAPGQVRPTGHSRVRPMVSARSLHNTEVIRRRRFFSLLAVSTLVFAIAWAGGVSVVSFGSATAASATGEAPAVHVVLPGDSYAAIAAGMGAANPIEAGEALRVANAGADLVVGQRILVDPARLDGAG